MSKENVKLFLEKVPTDEGLQEKLKNLHSENQDKIQESIVKLGAEAGYDFNEKDMQQLMEETAAAKQENGELDDAQLEAVAGGTSHDWLVMSLGTLGIGCLDSLDRRVFGEKGCKLDR